MNDQQVRAMKKTMSYLTAMWLIAGCAVQTDFSFDGLGTPGFVPERLDRIDTAIIAEVEAG